MNENSNPIRFLRVSAFGDSIAIEKSSIRKLLNVSCEALVATGNGGLIMEYENSIIPVVDFRAEATRDTGSESAAILTNVLSKNFVVLVDEVGIELDYSYSDDKRAGFFSAALNRYVHDCIVVGGVTVFVIDIERMMSPIIREHLLENKI